jgi:hypothetical protein
MFGVTARPSKTKVWLTAKLLCRFRLLMKKTIKEVVKQDVINLMRVCSVIPSDRDLVVTGVLMLPAAAGRTVWPACFPGYFGSNLGSNTPLQ